MSSLPTGKLFDENFSIYGEVTTVAGKIIFSYDDVDFNFFLSSDVSSDSTTFKLIIYNLNVWKETQLIEGSDIIIRLGYRDINTGLIIKIREVIRGTISQISSNHTSYREKLEDEATTITGESYGYHKMKSKEWINQEIRGDPATVIANRCKITIGEDGLGETQYAFLSERMGIETMAQWLNAEVKKTENDLKPLNWSISNKKLYISDSYWGNASAFHILNNEKFLSVAEYEVMYNNVPYQGFLFEATGVPELSSGDTIEVSKLSFRSVGLGELPKKPISGVMTLVRVEHSFGKRIGFLTSGILVPVSLGTNINVFKKFLGKHQSDADDVAHLIGELIDEKIDEVHAIDIGEIDKYVRTTQRADVKLGQNRSNLTNENSVDEVVSGVNKVMNKPIMMPFAGNNCGIIIPIKAGMRCIVGHSGKDKDDIVVLGFVWDKLKTIPPHNEGDFVIYSNTGIFKIKANGDIEIHGPTEIKLGSAAALGVARLNDTVGQSVAFGIWAGLLAAATGVPALIGDVGQISSASNKVKSE